jgi:Domain of unknown function (DUF4760)
MQTGASVCSCHAFLSALKDVVGAPWFQNVLLAISAVIGIYTIRSSSNQEKRRATVDIVRDQQKDTVLIEARNVVRALIQPNGKIDVDALLLGPDTTKEAKAVFTVLNAYEFIATGVRSGAFDGVTFRRMYYNTVLYYWNLFEDFVERYRVKYQRENPGVEGMNAMTLYRDFEDLAKDWIAHPLNQ